MHFGNVESAPDAGALGVRIAEIARVKDKPRLSHPPAESPGGILHRPESWRSRRNNPETMRDYLRIGEGASILVLLFPILSAAVCEVSAWGRGKNAVYIRWRIVFSNIKIRQRYEPHIIPRLRIGLAPRSCSSAQVEDYLGRVAHS